jgi:hypothetical protein
MWKIVVGVLAIVAFVVVVALAVTFLAGSAPSADPVEADADREEC